MNMAPVSTIKNALIVGGGVGGMASAIALAASGVAVDLIDLDPDWKVYGAGITITGPTLRAYRHLDMIEDIKTYGAIASNSRVFHFSGKWLHDLDEPALEEGLPATGGIMRPVLHQLMQKRIKAANIPVRLGLTVDALENRDDGVEVTFSDGSSHRYDLVIGADSIFSRVRKLAFPHAVEPPFTGQGCWRISIAKPPMLDSGEFYFGAPNPAGITRCGPDHVYLWTLVRDDKHERIPDAAMPDLLRDVLAGFGGSAGWIRDHIDAESYINYRPLQAAIQPMPWVNGRIVLLGDAAHATTPHLASGAGMAVESALVLQQELAAANDVHAGLEAYQARRFPRCKMVVDTSIAVGKLQLEGGSPDQIGAKIGGALHQLAAPF